MTDWICSNELRRIRCRHLNAPSEKLQQKWTRGKPVRYEYPEPDDTFRVSGIGMHYLFKSGPRPGVREKITVAGEYFIVRDVQHHWRNKSFSLLLTKSEPDYAEEWRDIPVVEV